MREIIDLFVQEFKPDRMNYPAQTLIIKKLLQKYSKEQLMYAIDYYSKKGTPIYSFGYFNFGMEKPLKEYKAVEDTSTWGDNSGERNKRKFTKDNQTRSGKKYNLDLFEKSNEGD